jgi:uncharacterized protein (DUF1786 family)
LTGTNEKTVYTSSASCENSVRDLVARFCTNLLDTEDIWEDEGLTKQLVEKVDDTDHDVCTAAAKVVVKLMKDGELVGGLIRAVFNIHTAAKDIFRMTLYLVNS